MGANGSGPLQLGGLLAEWERLKGPVDHVLVEEMIEKGQIVGERMRVEAESSHEMLLAGRLMSLDSTGGDSRGGDGDRDTHVKWPKGLDLVEARISQLEARLSNCSLESIRVAKEALAKKFITPRPTLLAHHQTNSFPTDAKEAPSDLILTISVYLAQRPGIKTQTFDVRSDLSLAELRDRISCITEKVVATLLQTCSRPEPHLPIAGPKSSTDGEDEETPLLASAYFLIEGVFYTDLRAANALDLSKDIRDWVAADTARRGDLVALEVRSMADVRWSDVPLRLNHPYSFIHCGRCSHYFCVEAVRLEHDYDRSRVNGLSSPPRSPLPLIRETYRMRRKRRRCHVCDLDRAAWITVNDRLAPENPCSFCQACYEALHYDEQGRLLYNDFRVYPYYHDAH